MSRATNKDITHNNVSSSSSSSPSSHGINHRVSSTTTTGASNGTNGSSTLMNGNGELVYRRSPISHHHHHHHNNHHHASPSAQSYYTLGSPSINTSYNSEEISGDLINSSLEEEHINDLSQRFEHLQRQVEVLTETQASQDERYKRSKQENDVLLNRIHSLEDQLRELEISSESRAQEDEKRFKDTMAKQMKLKSQECEQHLSANYLLQQDIIALQKDLLKNETLIRTLRSEKESLELELQEKNNELTNLDEEIHRLKLVIKNLKDEENVKSNIISILNEELEDNHHHNGRSQHKNNDKQNSSSASATSSNHHNNNLTSSPKQRSTSSRRSSVTSGFGEDFLASGSVNNRTLKDIDVLETSLSQFRDENKRLKETNEELQAQLLQAQLEEGKSLIQDGNKSYSLADEMGDIDVHKLMSALKEQQEDNARLRKYIDDILLKIVENNPEILDKTTNVSAR